MLRRGEPILSREGSVILFIHSELRPEQTKAIDDLLSSSKMNEIEIIHLTEGVVATDLLNSQRLQLQEVWIHTQAPAPGVLTFVELSRKKYPGIPIKFVQTLDPFNSFAPGSGSTTSTIETLPSQEFSRLSVDSILDLRDLQAYQDFKELKNLESQLLKTFSLSSQVAILKETVKKAKAALPIPALTIQTPVDSAYKAVPIAEFGHQAMTTYDVFVKLPSGRYLKLLKAGSSFEIERLIQYADKGITHLFIKRESHERTLTYVDILAKTLLTRQNIPDVFKLKHMCGQGDNLYQSLKKRGIDDLHLDYCKTFVNDFQTTLKLVSKKQGLPKSFFDSLIGYEHAVSCSIVASLLALRLFPDNEEDINVIGLAAYLHDIGLYQDPNFNYAEMDPYHLEDLEEFVGAERAFLEAHPERGAKILSRFEGMNPKVIDIVRHHHERRDHSGYAKKIGGTQITILCEVVAIADEFVRMLYQQRLTDDFTLESRFLDSSLPSYSYVVSREFKALYLTKPNPI